MHTLGLELSVWATTECDGRMCVLLVATLLVLMSLLIQERLRATCMSAFVRSRQTCELFMRVMVTWAFLTM